VIWNFTGFFQPVDDPPVFNLMKAGRAFPVRFSLDGFQGFGIFTPGHPRSETVACDPTQKDPVEETVPALVSVLLYNPLNDRYTLSGRPAAPGRRPVGGWCSSWTTAPPTPPNSGSPGNPPHPHGRVCVREYGRCGLSCTLVRMSSQPTPEPVELPEIPPEERAELEALKQRILAGDYGGTIPWDDLAAELGL